MNGIKYWILIVWLSIKWMFRITLGDKVLYQGKVYEVINGVSPATWKVINESCAHAREAIRVDCLKIWSLRGMIRSFKSGYRFYMTTWYRIWVRAGIEPWMRGCNIW